MANVPTQTQARKKVLEGVVVSDKMNKTVVVSVKRSLRHPFFEKVVRYTKKYKAHDELEQARVGDLVEIEECRPLSKTKHMQLKRIIKKAH